MTNRLSAQTSPAPCARLCVHTLTLTCFRNYASVSLEPVGNSVVLTGANGSGKTNLLEALSLMMPGRGLRNAKLVQLQHQAQKEIKMGWGVSLQADTPQGRVDFGTGQYPGREDKRVMKLDGEALKSQAELTEYFAVLWQTPQMDGLFVQSQSERRYYYDRVCSMFLPDHAAQTAKYDYLRRERRKLLATQGDAGWIGSLERKMAEASLAIAATRLEVLEILRRAIDLLHPAFPKATLALHGFAEKALQEAQQPAVEIEEQLAQRLLQSRVEDAQSGRASHGAHKTELEVVFEPKNVEASYCSTGEQKALMLSLLLAQAQAMKEHQNRLPILLLDEVVAHLDESRRQALFETLTELQCQSWMTGTDATFFESLDEAQHYSVSEGAISSL